MDLRIQAAIIAGLAVISMRASAQSSNCTSTILSLAPCLSYITSSDSSPSVPCCTKLVDVVQSEPRCLCLILGGGASQFGVTINQTKALSLPDACNVQTPPVSRCDGVIEASSPALPPGMRQGAPGGASRGNLLEPTILPVFIILTCFSLFAMSF